MTISNTKRLIRYQGNDAATSFDYDFLIPEETDVLVIIYDTLLETYTVLTSGQYSITGIGNPAYGAVIYPLAGAPLTTTSYIIIKRTVPYVQELDIEEHGAFLSDTLEEQLDKIVMGEQQLAEVQARSILYLEGESAIQPLPTKAILANKVLLFDANGDPTGGPSGDDIENAQSYANAAAVSASNANDSEVEASSFADAASASADAAAASAASVEIRRAPNKTALKAIATAACTVAFLAGQDWFDFKAGDYSALVAADTVGAIAIKADDTPTNEGAWIRRSGVAVAGHNLAWHSETGVPDIAAWANAVAVNNALGGGKIVIPAGAAVSMDTSATAINVTKPLEITGAGGNLPGTDTTGSILNWTSAGGSMFNITANGYVHIHDFAITSSGITKSVGTYALFVDSATIANGRFICERMLIDGAYYAIGIDDARRPIIRDCIITNFVGIGIVSANAVPQDLDVGLIENCLLWDIAGPGDGIGSEAVRWGNGGFTVSKCRFLGQWDYGLRFVFTATTTGSGPILVEGCNFERQLLYCMSFARSTAAATAGTEIGHVRVLACHFQCIDVGVLRAILVLASTGNWIDLIDISHCQVQNTKITSGGVFQINAGRGGMITHNTVDNTGGGDSLITTSGNADKMQVIHNLHDGSAGSVPPYTCNGSTVVIETQGMVLGFIGTWAVGSTVYCTNGNPASNPLASGGSPTGCIATRQGSTPYWKGQ